MDTTELQHLAGVVNDLICRRVPVHVIWRSPAVGPSRIEATGVMDRFELTGSDEPGPVIVDDHFVVLSEIVEIRDESGAARTSPP